MARKIKSTEEAAGDPAADVIPENGVCFANNHPNRNFTTGKGVPFKFTGTRQYFTNPDEIAVLEELCKDPYSRVFKIDADPVAEPAAEPAEPKTEENISAETTTE